MAQAPGHRLGQIIGDTLELAIGPALAKFADRHDLYLDGKGEREARPGKKVTWQDDLGNAHDLDHVLERGGSDEKLGVPVAFIESAWRRYTKHSRNKAQEIQGAILPLMTTWAHVKPFAGVVLAGVWTEGSINQLRSNDFSVLHINYDTIVDVFRVQDIDVLYEESTPDRMLQAQIDRWEELSDGERENLGQTLRDAISTELKVFMDQLSATILRRVECISILPLHGRMIDCRSVREARRQINAHDPDSDIGPLVRFEVIVRYDNGDDIAAGFDSSEEAITFIDSFK